MSRADRRTSTEHQVEYFSDFTINLDRNPVTGLLAKVTNEEAITQSIRNLVRTALTERFYEPLVGSKAATALFDLAGPQATAIIKSTTEAVIKNCEKRANLIGVDVQQQDYTFVVNVSFECVNMPGRTLFTSVILKKIR